MPIDPSVVIPPFRRLIPNARWSIHPGDRHVALTFDDGPNSIHTPRLLDTLENRGVLATFFWLGASLNRAQEVARQVASRGHVIGLHGDVHIPFPIRKASLVQRGLESLRSQMAEVTGRDRSSICLVRPPFGWVTRSGVDRLQSWGFETVLCDILPGDWRASPDLVVKRVLRRVRPGSIIALHDGADNGANAATIVDRLFTELTNRDFKFVPIGPEACQSYE